MCMHWTHRPSSQEKNSTWEKSRCFFSVASRTANEEYASAQAYEPGFSQGRFHHEIYLSDVRRCQSEKLKTVIRQPIKRTE